MIKEIRFYLGLMVAVAMLLVAPTNLKAFDGISVGINLTGSNMDTDGFEYFLVHKSISLLQTIIFNSTFLYNNKPWQIKSYLYGVCSEIMSFQ